MKETINDFTLKVPLDASSIKDFEPGQAVKVVARDGKGSFHSQTIELGERGIGGAIFTFPEHPGQLRVYVGPTDASDEEFERLQTIYVDVWTSLWRDERELKLHPIVIPSYHWSWWLKWCQTFTIRGHVVCPNGDPVPAAKVCAYDVDTWFIWTSKQEVGCATTDINGAFEIEFRWCCHWWPWWWWGLRIWEYDPFLAQRVNEMLLSKPDVRLSPTASQWPTLKIFNELLGEEVLGLSDDVHPDDVDRIEKVRALLLERLPPAPELERLHLWPWYPWYPWWDCTPDIIFKVTQDCEEPGTVIIEESIGDTRWNIENSLDVKLIANELACCRTTCQDPPCDEGKCLVFTQVCNSPINTIGGNPDADPAPEGYLRPGAVTAGTAEYDGDRPFGGVVNVWKNSGNMAAIDYYEIEYGDGTVWQPLPPGAGLTITRHWLFWDGTDWLSGTQAFPYDATTFPGHTVYESREHFEATGPYSDWWPVGGRFWTLREFLILHLDSNRFPDGTYHFRVKGYRVDAGGNLENVIGDGKPLPFCGPEEMDNYLVLTFDNRVIDPLLDTPLNPCGAGTVKICTTEPTTDFISVMIGGQEVDLCGVVDASSGMLEIVFKAHDPNGHLARYWLWATYRENLKVNLLDLLSEPGASLVLVSGDQVGPTYGEALGQGATEPRWYGGTMHLTVPADQAFPDPCCYQLELGAWKRTVVNCNEIYPHRNWSGYTIGVGVCPPVQEVKEEPVI
jgi:hypothetical protein